MKHLNEWTISQSEFEPMIEQGWKVVDVRSTMELSYLRIIPVSINIPYPDVVNKMEELFPDKNEKLIIVCNAGNRSGITAKTYHNAGYKNVFVLNGGIESLPN